MKFKLTDNPSEEFLNLIITAYIDDLLKKPVKDKEEFLVKVGLAEYEEIED